MSKDRRANIVIGIMLMVLGGWFLAGQFFPALKEITSFENSWPLIVIGVGLFLLILGLLIRTPGLAVPACIVGGIGGILYWQFLTGDWVSWAYMWTLIPGFVGVGVILARILGDEDRSAYRSGFKLIVTSLVLFVVFFLFLGGGGILRDYWPVLVILVGIWVFAQAVLRRK